MLGLVLLVSPPKPADPNLDFVFGIFLEPFFGKKIR
jgi:hypothetical protein